MKEEELLDLYRRYEFNKTAGETLVRLVGDAIEKGERVRATSRELKSLAARLATELVERGLIFGADRLPEKGSHLERWASMEASPPLAARAERGMFLTALPV